MKFGRSRFVTQVVGVCELRSRGSSVTYGVVGGVVPGRAVTPGAVGGV